MNLLEIVCYVACDSTSLSAGSYELVLGFLLFIDFPLAFPGLSPALDMPKLLGFGNPSSELPSSGCERRFTGISILGLGLPEVASAFYKLNYPDAGREPDLPLVVLPGFLFIFVFEIQKYI